MYLTFAHVLAKLNLEFKKNGLNLAIIVKITQKNIFPNQSDKVSFPVVYNVLVYNESFKNYWGAALQYLPFIHMKLLPYNCAIIVTP